jgi:hypothetical protein
MAIWLMVGLCRSAACFISTSLRMTGSGAQIQPSRSPGDSVLEKLPHRIVRARSMSPHRAISSAGVQEADLARHLAREAPLVGGQQHGHALAGEVAQLQAASREAAGSPAGV